MTTDVDELTIQPTVASGAWAEVEAGAYNAVIDSIEDTGISPQYPDSGPQLKIGFALVDQPDENGNPVVLNRWISQKWSEKSNLFLLARACGLATDPSEPFKVSSLRFAECQVVVVRKNAGKENERPGIETFLPRQKAKAAAKAPLAQRLAPKAAEEAESDVGPCVVCDAPGTAFTSKGKPVCEAHKTL